MGKGIFRGKKKEYPEKKIKRRMIPESQKTDSEEKEEK